jgi:hypothetical protein
MTVCCGFKTRLCLFLWNGSEIQISHVFIYIFRSSFSRILWSEFWITDSKLWHFQIYHVNNRYRWHFVWGPPLLRKQHFSARNGWETAGPNERYELKWCWRPWATMAHGLQHYYSSYNSLGPAVSQSFLAKGGDNRESNASSNVQHSNVYTVYHSRVCWVYHIPWGLWVDWVTDAIGVSNVYHWRFSICSILYGIWLLNRLLQ